MVKKKAASLQATFEEYVSAVQRADLRALFRTITTSKQFYFLTAQGTIIQTRKEYREFHRNWFKQKNWKMPVDIVHIYEGEDYGYVIAIFHYRQKIPGGLTYQLDSYFTLIFKKERNNWRVVSDICTPIKRSFVNKRKKVEYSAEQMNYFDLLKKRRTVRQFTSQPVPDAHICRIIDCARFAPSAGNQQPWQFLVVRDSGKLKQLKRKITGWQRSLRRQKGITRKQAKKARSAVQEMLKGVFSAPVFIIVLANKKAQYTEHVVYDGILAAGYLMVAARALGYGSGFFTTFFPENIVREVFAVPEHYRFVCFMPIGVPAEWPDPPNKKPLKQIVIFESF